MIVFIIINRSLFDDDEILTTTKHYNHINKHNSGINAHTRERKKIITTMLCVWTIQIWSGGQWLNKEVNNRRRAMCKEHVCIRKRDRFKKENYDSKKSVEIGKYKNQIV